MILYVANRNLMITTVASDELPGTYQIIEDSRVDDLDSGVSTLSFTIAHPTSIKTLSKYAFAPGNFVLTENDNNEYIPYTIITAEDDSESGELELYCEDAGLDLLNDVCDADDGKTAKTAETFLKDALRSSGFEIGESNLNPDLKKNLSLSVETGTERLKKIAEAFDLDFYFTFTKGKYNKIAHKYVHLVTKRGNQNPHKLYINKDIKNIKIKRSVEDLATALLPTGANDVNLKNWDYDDGDYYVEKNSGRLISRKGYSKWSRYLGETLQNTGDQNITVEYSDTSVSDKGGLLASALKDLKSRDDAKVTYDVELYDTYSNVYGLRVGDVVDIIDDDGEIYVESRIKSVTVSETAHTINVNLGDFKELSSGINETVMSLVTQVTNKINNLGRYTWIAYASDQFGSDISKEPFWYDAKGDRYYQSFLGTATNQMTEDYTIPTDADELELFKQKFVWVLIKGRDGIDGNSPSINIVRLNGGVAIALTNADGLPTKNVDDSSKQYYIHIRYSNDTQKFTGDDGKKPGKYIGLYMDDKEGESVLASDYEWSVFSGDTGDVGTPLKRSKNGITYLVHFAYSTSADGKQNFAVTWYQNAKYVGVRVDNELNDPNDPTAYQWDALSGEVVNVDGASLIEIVDSTGSNVVKVGDGLNGQSTYVHYAYANSPDGRTDFSTSDPTGREYVGTCTDYDSMDPTNPDLYAWSKFVGNKGDNGRAITKTKLQYKYSISSTDPDAVGKINTITVDGETINYDTNTNGANSYVDSSGTLNIDGVSITELKSTDSYAQWSDQPPKLIVGFYLWSRTVIYYDSFGADAYSAKSTYMVYDYAVYGDVLYKCKVAVTTPEDFNSDHWSPFIYKEIESGETVYKSYSDPILELQVTEATALADSHIQQSRDSIELEATKTYATKTTLKDYYTKNDIISKLHVGNDGYFYEYSETDDQGKDAITTINNKIEVNRKGIDLIVDTDASGNQTVNGDHLVSAINMSDTKIEMKALNINMDGYVTFSNLINKTDATKYGYKNETFINGGNINTHSLNVDKITGKWTSETYITADGKSHTYSTGNPHWAIDFDKGIINIGTVEASKIIGKLTDGTTNSGWSIDFDAGKMTIGNISADKLTSGTINGRAIKASTITGSTFYVDNGGGVTLTGYSDTSSSGMAVEGSDINSSSPKSTFYVSTGGISMAAKNSIDIAVSGATNEHDITLSANSAQLTLGINKLIRVQQIMGGKNVTGYVVQSHGTNHNINIDWGSDNKLHFYVDGNDVKQL